MKSLFLKIFLSYWMAQALFLALAILITLAVREHGETATWDAQQATVLSKAIQTFSVIPSQLKNESQTLFPSGASTNRPYATSAGAR